MTPVRRLTVRAVAGLPDLVAGADLAGLVAAGEPADGDVVVVSSKAVAKAEGRTRAVPREEVVADETARVVAARGPLRIVRTRHGLVLAAAGVDESNTAPGTVVPLPTDPDGSARRLRADLLRRTGRNVAVLVTDTAGRPWRIGQTDIAVGCAGLAPLLDLAGHRDGWGRPLAVTAPAIADEAAGAAELVLAKAARTPVAVLSGLAAHVLPVGEEGPGAAALVRSDAEDLFGLGSREAVHAATRRGPGDASGFAAGAAEGLRGDRLRELAGAAGMGLAAVEVSVTEGPPPTATVRPAQGRGARDPEVLLAAGAVGERLRALAWADRIALVTADRAPGTVLALCPEPAP